MPFLTYLTNVLASFNRRLSYLIDMGKFAIAYDKSKPDRFRELVLHVSKRCADAPLFGSIKLNKILFVIDFEWYKETGESISGAVYKKNKLGPTAVPMVPAISKMTELGDLRVESQRIYNRTQARTVALREPHMSIFSDKERTHIDHWIDALWGASGMALSDWSHEFGFWDNLSMGEEIPYSAAFWPKKETIQFTEFDRARAERAIALTKGQTS